MAGEAIFERYEIATSRICETRDDKILFMHTLFLGTSGYNYKEWRGKFYPEKLPQKQWLYYYAEQYDTVEINNSFYSSVKKETYENWYNQTPKEFTFVIKGHRYITQLKKLQDVEEPVALFFSNAKALKDKLSCVLWQFPASFRVSAGKEHEYLQRLETFLKLLPTSVRHAFEFRDTSWFTDEVNKLLRSYNASLIISQSAKFPEIELLNGIFAYIRFHGPAGLYTSGYSDESLAEWAIRIKKYLQTQDVYVYFNNDAGGWAIGNSQTLKKLIRE